MARTRQISKEQIEAFLESNPCLWAESTINTARGKLLHLTRTGLHPKHFHNFLKEKGLGSYTRKQYLIIASVFEREMFDTDLFLTFINKVSHVFRNSYKEKTKRMTKEDFQKCLDAVGSVADSKIFNLLILMGKGGLRISEAMRARWDHFDMPNILTVLGKGQFQREVPFAMDHLVKNNGNYIGRFRGYRYYFTKFLEPWTPHDFRAYYLSQLSNTHKRPIKEVQTLAGHKCLASTMRYIRYDAEDAKEWLLNNFEKI